MEKLQKAGGIAAVFEALAYIVGFVMMATLFNPEQSDGWSHTQKLSFVLEHKALYQVWNLVIYVAFGVALVVLCVALHSRLQHNTGNLMKLATPFGLIWAGLVIASGMVANVGLESVASIYTHDVNQATTTWLTISAVQNGLGGGVELVGGLWVLLVSGAAMRAAAWSTALSYLGLVVGVAGMLTVIPSLGDLAVVFGVSQILWFGWLGFVMLRGIASK